MRQNSGPDHDPCGRTQDQGFGAWFFALLRFTSNCTLFVSRRLQMDEFLNPFCLSRSRPLLRRKFSILFFPWVGGFWTSQTALLATVIVAALAFLPGAHNLSR